MTYTKGKWDKKGNKVKVHGRGIIAICPSPTFDYGVLEFIANAQLIASAPDLYEACKFVDAYFQACVKQWASGERIMPNDEDTVRVAADELDNLCDMAAEKVANAIAKAEGK